MASVLVAYGIPPNKIKLFSSTGMDLHKTWQFDPKTFTGPIRAKFEELLRTALPILVKNEIPDIVHADYRFVSDAQTLQQVLAHGGYTHLVYYGHALADGVTLLPLHRITAPQLAQVLKGATVKHVDILGCNSSAIGALLASLAPGVQVGVLRGKRFDDFEVNMQTMQPTDFRILPQPVYHFGSTAK